MQFYRLFLSCLLLCYTSFLFAQISLKAPVGKKNYKWHREGNVISGANGATYLATIPGTYFATFEEMNSCTITSSYFLLADNCNLGNAVKIDMAPGCVYEKIAWSNGEEGERIHVMATNTLTSYSARIDIDENYTLFRSFQVMQFDTACCMINNTGIITVVPSN